jgi:hypothetical protein
MFELSLNATKSVCKIKIVSTYKHVFKLPFIKCVTLNTHSLVKYYSWYIKINSDWFDNRNLKQTILQKRNIVDCIRYIPFSLNLDWGLLIRYMKIVLHYVMIELWGLVIILKMARELYYKHFWDKALEVNCFWNLSIYKHFLIDVFIIYTVCW